jgi:hypothetical protein
MSTRYSATVKLELICGDKIIPLTHICNMWIRPQKAISLPPGPAEIIVRVDGIPHTMRVNLPDGMKESDTGERVTVVKI